jgi:hypothetical protein
MTVLDKGDGRIFGSAIALARVGSKRPPRWGLSPLCASFHAMHTCTPSTRVRWTRCNPRCSTALYIRVAALVPSARDRTSDNPKDRERCGACRSSSPTSRSRRARSDRGDSRGRIGEQRVRSVGHLGIEPDYLVPSLALKFRGARVDSALQPLEKPAETTNAGT